jgi:membrane protease YdiL (CAAX protease family)
MSQSSPKPPPAPSPPQPHRAPPQPMTGARLAATVAVWITLSLVAGGATVLLRSMLAPALTADTLAVIIVTEVYVLLIVVLLAAVGGWSAAVAAFGLRSPSRQALVGVLVVGALSVATLLGYAVVGAWAPLAEELVWVGRDGGRLGSLDPVTTAITLVRGTLLAALGEELLFRGALFGWLRARLPAWPTIVLTATLWTAMHVGLLVALPYVLVQGLGLGWLRERSGSVVPGMVFHAVHNSVLFAAVFVLVGW